MSIYQALESFINDDSGAVFEQAVKDSTHAGFAGSGYSVELFDDGTYRVLWNGAIGNLYVSPGIILNIPSFDQDTINDINAYGDDADLSFALSDIEQDIRDKFAYVVGKGEE